jgi:hypothetical protein
MGGATVCKVGALWHPAVAKRSFAGQGRSQVQLGSEQREGQLGASGAEATREGGRQEEEEEEDWERGFQLWVLNVQSGRLSQLMPAFPSGRFSLMTTLLLSFGLGLAAVSAWLWQQVVALQNQRRALVPVRVSSRGPRRRF